MEDAQFVERISALIFWLGGYLALPFVFMATMGVFRNLAGMSQSLTSRLGGKVRERGRQERARYQKFRFANREQGRDEAAMRRAAIAAAGPPWRRASRQAAARAWGQQINQQKAEQAIQDSAYTWKNDGNLNYEYLRARGDEATLRRNGVSNENIQRMQMMENKYGRAAMLQAAHTQAIVGKADAYNEDPGLIWRDAADLAGYRFDADGNIAQAGDDHVLNSLIGRGKGVALNGGWGVAGGATFGGIRSLARRESSYEQYLDNVIDNAAPGTLFHPSMSDETVEAVSDRLRERVAQTNQALTTAATPGERERLQRVLGQRLADAANFYDLARSLPSGRGNFVANRLMGGDGGDGMTIRAMVERIRPDKDPSDAISMGYHEKRYDPGPERSSYDTDRTRVTPTDLDAGPTPPLPSGPTT